VSERPRNFWGWGWEDALPSEDARRGLAAQVGALFGRDVVPRPLPRLEDVTLDAPRLRAPAHLAEIASDAKRERVLHTFGRAYPDLVRGFTKDFGPAPDLVLLPRNEADVAACLAFGVEQRVAIVPFGGGTSVVGGIECVCPQGMRGVASLDMRRMNEVLDLDETSRAARIQAGATGPALETKLVARGFSLRHFPQSFEHSTLGGWIATRAGGHYATLMTHIDDLVESVRVVTPTGVWASRRVPASGAGPSPDRLVLGSEGILGVITEAWMRIVPRPRWRASANVYYARFADGAEACRALTQSGLHPTNCRLLDAREAMLHGVADGSSAVLLLGFESADHPLEPWMTRALEIAHGTGGVCPKGAIYKDAGDKVEADAGAAWRRAFLDAPYLQSALVTLGIVVDTFETACTWLDFPDLYVKVERAVNEAMKDACGGGLLTCRFTHVYPDGPAPYFTFLAPGREGEEVAQWRAIKRAASDAIAAAGGTITHHHAVGRTHRPWYDKERPEPFARALVAAKRAVDPSGILNPGVLVDP
jgi:alkyldihydroxyacetonephosphate synthase